MIANACKCIEEYLQILASQILADTFLQLTPVSPANSSTEVR